MGDPRRGRPDPGALLQTLRPEVPVRSLERLGAGDFCEAWLLNGHEVVRVPRHGEAARALAREACVLPEIADQLPLAVPRPRLFGRPGNETSSFAVHERIDGVALTRERWWSMAESMRVGLAGAVGSFLAALHAVDPAVGDACGVPSCDHRQRAGLLRERLAGIAGAVLPRPIRRTVDGRLTRYVDGGPEWAYRPALLNADLGPDHVLFDPEHRAITGVIDWGDVATGDPARDFIFVYEDWGDDFLDAALNGYAREPKDRMLPRVHAHWLMDQLDWTLRAQEGGRESDAGAGASFIIQHVLRT